MRPVRIGLSGPIGCGKSTVAGWLAAEGAVVIDADQVAHAVTAPGTPELEAVVARFGEACRRPDGTLDRPALGRLVFADAAALADLEAIVHPAVHRRLVAAIAAAEADRPPAIVIEAIKLVEAGLAAACDEVWLVDCPPDVQAARLVGRGLAPDEAERRMAAQTGVRERVGSVATRTIDAAAGRQQTRRAVRDALAAAIALAAAAADPSARRP
jgi:dephospho-CoA kinase